MRTEAQKHWDRFVVLLHLFGKVEECGSIVEGNLKAQKLIFLSELEGHRSDIKSSHYRFFRYNLGPYSVDLANDIRKIEKAGLATKTSRTLTKRGRFLRDYLLGALEDDGWPANTRNALNIVERVSREFGRRTGNSLMNLVYGMTVPVFDLGREERVRDIPTFLDILDPVHSDELAEVEGLSPELIEDIKEELAIDNSKLESTNPSFKQTIRRSLSAIT